MATRLDRFRRLHPPESGDLFAHFGIALEPASASASETTPAVVVARACHGCGWLVTPDDASCFVCGTANPSAAGATPR